MIKWLSLTILIFCFACTNDDIFKNEKAGFTNIYKNILLRSLSIEEKKLPSSKTVYNKKWLSKYSQPIIALSSPNHTDRATLVALGNQNDKLTWVSADGLSVSFDNGILIATRGYSQDLMESHSDGIDSIFNQITKTHNKTYRYLNGQNEYTEMKFSCTMAYKEDTAFSLLDLTLNTTKFTESCKSGPSQHTNIYYVLPNTNIVLKSQQWISETNGYIDIYNYYAFQGNI